MPKDKHPQEQIKLAHQVVSIIRAEFSGPLPPPEVLERYNNVIPNGADRIMSMAEEQSKHRRSLEAKAMSTDSRNSLLGVIFAFVLGLSTIISGTYVILKGQVWPGTLLGSLGLVGLVSAFIYGTKQRREERESKARAN
jgi:uncharacterized membrane protein